MKKAPNFLFAATLLMLLMGVFGYQQIESFQKQDDSFLNEKIEDWQVRLELARVLSYQKKYDESVKEYLEVLAKRPNDPKLQLELASVYAYKKDKTAALDLLNKIHFENDAEGEKQIANIFAILKEYSTAEQHYLNYLNTHPDDLGGRLKYAEMLSWEKRYPDSIHQYELILKEVPDDEQVRRKYALVLIWMGNTEQGAEELKKTLK